MADTKRILIVEDERPLAHALDLKLQHVGWQTTVATDGKQALTLLQEQTFDVALLDLMMPQMDGFQVLTELQKQSGAPKIFVLSNLNQPEDEKRALELGAQKFFVKADTPLATIVEEVSKA